MAKVTGGKTHLMSFPYRGRAGGGTVLALTVMKITVVVYRREERGIKFTDTSEEVKKNKTTELCCFKALSGHIETKIMGM